MNRKRPDDREIRPTRAQPATAGGGRSWLGPVVIGVLVLGGGAALIGCGDGGGEAEPPQGGDHWHAAFGVNVCGQFEPNIPPFETRAGSNESAGIHSHGDGLIHIHPFAPDETGDNATVGRYIDYAGGSLSGDSITLPGGTTFSNGDRCRDGRVGEVRWSVNGEERKGDPGAFKPEDGDVVVVGFLPAGDDLGRPASAAIVATPSDT